MHFFAVVPYSILHPFLSGREAAYRNWIIQRNQRQSVIPEARGNSFRIVLYIGQLGPGGSERQLCNLAYGLHAKGHRISVITASPLVGQNAHYVGFLQSVGIPVRRATNRITNQCARQNGIPNAPLFIRSDVERLSHELSCLKPDVLHCWLDYTNIVGGIAGIASDVRCIVLSGRSLRPTLFPDMIQPWMKTWYRILLSDERIVMTNNSYAGGEDYAQWLEIPPDRIPIVYNGLSNPSFMSERGKDFAWRESVGISKDTHLIGGFFRLSEEKCPLDFLRILRIVRDQIPDTMAVLVGDGPLSGFVDRTIRELRLESAIKRLMRVNDVGQIMAACDVVLLTSCVEGTPNVLLEAQHSEIPVVATDVGGVREAIAPAGRHNLCKVHDIDTMSARVVDLLKDKQKRVQEGNASKMWVQSRFSMDRMVAAYDQLYTERFLLQTRP